MNNVAFLKPVGKFEGFGSSLGKKGVVVCEMRYDILADFRYKDYEIILIGVDETNLKDIEMFLTNISFFYEGRIVVVDEEFCMRRKHLFFEYSVLDYYYLPLDMNEFCLNLEWFLKKDKIHKQCYKNLILDKDSRTISRAGNVLGLKNMEYRLLKYLMDNNGKILSKERILEEVWDMNSLVSSKTVEVHICRLRDKMDRNYDEKLLHTIPNTGYMLK